MDNRQPILEELKATSAQGAASESILFWTPEQRRVGFGAVDEVVATSLLRASSTPYELGRSLQDISQVAYQVDDATYTVADFIDLPESISMLVVKDNQIIHESYAPGNTPDTRWISFSVTKSVTSMLIGAAIQDGYIESEDEPVVHYLPRLRGTAYESATIKDILQMASGVRWNEDYADKNSDVAKAGAANGITLVNYLADLPVDAESGTKFNYNTGETNLVGEVLRSAIGNNASNYLSEKIWQPFGMEFDATWVLDRAYGAEMGGCCISASLRDYARLGLFAMSGGRLADGTQVLPADWMEKSIQPSTAQPRYGYLWWLNGDGSYAARGIFGQVIYVDPAQNLVIALHNSSKQASDRAFGATIQAMLLAIRAHLTGS